MTMTTFEEWKDSQPERFSAAAQSMLADLDWLNMKIAYIAGQSSALDAATKIARDYCKDGGYREYAQSASRNIADEIEGLKKGEAK